MCTGHRTFRDFRTVNEHYYDMECLIPALQHISCIEHEHHIYLDLDQFFKSLATEEKCLARSLPKDAFRQKFTKSIICKDEKQYCRLTAILNYCSSSTLATCKSICKQFEYKLVQTCSTPKETICEPTILGIYRNVATFDFGKVAKHLKHALEHFNVDEIPSLYACHKENFSEFQWKKIRYFEWHYYLHVDHADDDSLDEAITKRENFLKQLSDLQHLSHLLTESAKQTIKRRKRRQTVGSFNNIKLDYGTKSHIPDFIERDVLAEISELHPNVTGSVIVHNCAPGCVFKEHGAHVYVDIGDGIEDVETVTPLIVSTLSIKYHNLPCESVTYFDEPDISKHVKAHNKFKAVDEIHKGTFNDKIQYVWHNETSHDTLEITQDTKCETCFPGENLKPLHWSTFENVEEEWVTDVPLATQMLLESYINHVSIRKSNDLDVFLKDKTMRLYGLYDSLLNTLNRTPFGILQELNTSEVMINYHNLTDMFQWTKVMGITKGQTAAEKEWKDRATNDLAYYNYAIRKWALSYETDAGLGEHAVSMRDCFKIATRDNLVTLTHRSNPEPGASRTGQVDTIQGTDLGVPKDSLVISQIHAENECDGSDGTCLCLHPVTLTKDDYQQGLLSFTRDEEHQMKKLRKLCTWGNLAIWTKLHDDEKLFEYLLKNFEGEEDEKSEDDVHLLEDSFCELDISTEEGMLQVDDDDLHEIKGILERIESSNACKAEATTTVRSFTQQIDSDLSY